VDVWIEGEEENIQRITGFGISWVLNGWEGQLMVVWTCWLWRRWLSCLGA